MGNVLVKEETLTAIAESIRGKHGSTELYKPKDMPEAIDNIPVGEGLDKNAEVCFYGLEGKLLYNYTLDEVKQLTELPPIPASEGLIAQGWNWSLESIQNANREVDVGAIYITNDGSTRIYVNLREGQLSPILGFGQSKANAVLVDWGDGSELETTDAWGYDNPVDMQHQYKEPGKYVIRLIPQSDSITIYFLGNSKGSVLLRKDTLVSDSVRGYLDSIEKIEIGKRVRISSDGGTRLGIKSVVIPEDIVYMEKGFGYCNELKYVAIPKSIKIFQSISRFARNTVDCLTIIRKLKGLKEPVEVYFEKERLYSLDEKTDMVLSLMASIAQEESRSISANIRWAIKNRMKSGTQKIPTSGLLGYENDDDGNMVIIESEAEIVRIIYKSFVQGVHPGLIAVRLNELGLRTVYGNEWSSSSVRKILQNEKYCGDVLMQKTITVDYLSHVSKPNKGEAEQYYIADHHDAIVSRELWDKAQILLNKQSWLKWKRREQQRFMPVRTGVLKGFVSIISEWKAVSIGRLLNASNKILEDEGILINNETVENNEREENIMSEIKLLEGFEVVELDQSKGDSVLTLTSTNLKFNKATAVELGYPSHVRMLINATTRQVAIQPCKENTKNAIEFSKGKENQTYAVVVKVPALLTAARKMADLGEDATATSFKGILYPNDNIIIYNLSEGEPVKRRGRKKKNSEE